MENKLEKYFCIILCITFATEQFSCQVPVIQDFPLFVAVPESLPIGSILFNGSAYHQDVVQNIIIKTVGSETSDIVYINQTSGSNITFQVITKSELDQDGDGRGHPGKNQVQLKFLATDPVFNQIDFYVTMYISDINDNIPTLINQPYIWEISELFKSGIDNYTQPYAVDLDSGNFGTTGIRYSMESGANNNWPTFKIDEFTGAVSFQGAVDFETYRFYQFEITATDDRGNGKSSVPAMLRIRILDVQDTPPVFERDSYISFVQQSTVVNTFVVKVYAFDGDIGSKVPNPVKYSILQGKCSDFFNIKTNGEIRTAKRLDNAAELFETSCELTVMAEEIDADPGKQYGLTKSNVTVHVIVENDDGSNKDDCSDGTMHNVGVIIPVAVLAFFVILCCWT